MRYLVQANHRHKYASIHEEHCSFAKTPRHRTENTAWFGTYDTYEAARERARRAYRNDIRDCSYCQPDRVE